MFCAAQEHFCDRCRANGVLVPARRLRALPCSSGEVAYNSSADGLFADGSALNLTSGGFRLINHTQGCTPPALCVLEVDGAETVGLEWAPLPPAWMDAAGGSHVRLWLSKG